MDKLPNVIPAALIHIINTLENDSDHQFLWKLSRNSERVSLFVKCEIRAKTVDGEKPFPVKRKPGNRKKKSPSTLRRQKARKQRFQEKKRAEKAVLPKSPATGVNTAVRQEQESSSVSSVDSCVDLDVYGQAKDLTCSEDKSSENQTLENIPSPDSEIAAERAILLDLLHQTEDIDSDDNSFEFTEINNCSNCKRQPQKGVELKRCSRCHITKYCSVECQRKDWDFHRFACSVVAKSATKKT